MRKGGDELLESAGHEIQKLLLLFTLRDWGIATGDAPVHTAAVEPQTGEPFMEVAFWTGPRPDRQRVADARREREQTWGAHFWTPVLARHSLRTPVFHASL